MKKRTHYDFVNEINKILPNIIIIGDYKNSKTKIRVIDDLGIKYLVYPNSLLQGVMPTIKTAEDVDEFLRIKLKETLNLTYLSGFTNYRGRIYVKDCDEIIYKVSCGDLLRNEPSTPSLLSAVDKNDGFIKKSKKIHQDKYDYSIIYYVNSRVPLNIICREHGLFKQIPVNHLRGCGCPQCGLKNTINNLTTNHIGWSNSKWTSVGEANNGKPKIYFVNVYNDQENFIKIGRTYKEINERLNFLLKIGYNYDVIKIIEGDYGFIYQKEREILKKYGDYKYTPKYRFNGYTECFLSEIRQYI